MNREAAHEVLRADEMESTGRYRLLTSLVVPRPIAWVGTRSADGTPNLAPFSYFAALSATPMLVSVSIGSRRGRPKDTLQNVRDRGAFCVNLVTRRHLESMNASAAEVEPEVDEFELAGVELAEAAHVDAPYVADAPAVLECRLFREIPLGDGPNTLVIGEVVAVRLGEELQRVGDTGFVDCTALRPVGRLWGRGYAVVTEMLELERPRLRRDAP